MDEDETPPIPGGRLPQEEGASPTPSQAVSGGSGVDKISAAATAEPSSIVGEPGGGGHLGDGGGAPEAPAARANGGGSPHEHADLLKEGAAEPGGRRDEDPASPVTLPGAVHGAGGEGHPPANRGVGGSLQDLSSAETNGGSGSRLVGAGVAGSPPRGDYLGTPEAEPSVPPFPGHAPMQGAARGAILGGRKLLPPQIDMQQTRTSSSGTDMHEVERVLSVMSQDLEAEQGVAEEAETEMESMLKLLYLKSVQEPPGRLDFMLKKKMHDLLSQDRGSSWVYSPMPLAALLCRKWFASMLVLVGMAYLVFGCIASSFAATGGIVSARYFRLTALELRGGGNVSEMRVADLGVLLHGCEIEGADVRSDGGVFVSEYDSVKRMDGWYFTTNGDRSDLDPVRFLLEGSTDGEEWEVVGSSSFVQKHLGGQVYLDGLADVSLSRLSVHDYFLMPHWSWFLDSVVLTFVFGVGYCGGALAGMWGSGRMSKGIILVLYMVVGVGHLIAGAGSLASGLGSLSSNAALHFAKGVVELVMLLMLVFDEGLVIEAIMLGGSAQAIVEILDVFVWTANTDKLGPLIFVDLLCFFFAIILYAYRQRVFRSVADSVRNDARKYKELWLAMTADMNEDQVLDEIASLAEQMERATTRAADLHQTNKVNRVARRSRRHSFWGAGQSRDSGAFMSPSMIGTPVSGANSAANVTSLDQLMAAAHGLNPILKGKVKEWARKSGGKFPLKTKHTVGFVRWEDAEKPGNASLKTKIKWASVKDPKRALEKILFLYRGDASSITDLCRQCIVFEHFADALLALQEISSDEDVVVERITNRLHPNYDVGRSAGYRDIKLNLRIQNDDTTELRLNTHICEVLLIPRKMMELWSDDKHARYLGFRNLRNRSNLNIFKRIKLSALGVLSSVGRAKQLMILPPEVHPEEQPPQLDSRSSRSNTNMARQAAQGAPGRGTQQGSIQDRRKMRIQQVKGGDSIESGDVGDEDKTSPQNGRQRHVSIGDPMVPGTLSNGSSKRDVMTVVPDGNGSPTASPATRTLDGAKKVTKVGSPPKSVGGSKSNPSMPKAMAPNRGPSMSFGAEMMKHSAAESSKSRRGGNGKWSASFDVENFEGREASFDGESKKDAGAHPDYERDGFMSIVRAQFVRFVTEQSSLDNGLKNWHSAMASANPASAFYTSRPLATALCKRNVQAGAVTIGAAFLSLALVLTYTYAYTPMYEYSTYRFTALEARGGPATSPGIQHFGVMLDLCSDPREIQSETWDGASVTVAFAEPLYMNGWYFVTSEGDPDGDPVRFVLEGTNNASDSAGWEAVGSSSWSRRLQRIGFTNGIFDTPTARGFVVEIDMQLNAWDLVKLVGIYVKSAGFALAGLAGHLERAFFGKWCIIVAFILYSLTLFAGLASRAALSGLSLEMVPYAEALLGLEGSVAVVYAALVAFLERWYVLCQAVTAAVFLAIYIVLYAVILHQEGVMVISMLGDTLLLSSAVLITMMRQRILRTSGQMIESDKEMYEAVWRDVTRKDTGKRCLEQISNLIVAQGLDKSRQPPRQFNRLQKKSRSDGSVAVLRKGTVNNLLLASRNGQYAAPNPHAITSNVYQNMNRTMRTIFLKGASCDLREEQRNLDWNSPVTSLDQLMTQAQGVDPMLRIKAQGWALASQGQFPLNIVVDASTPPELQRTGTLSKLKTSLSVKNLTAVAKQATVGMRGRRKSVALDEPRKKKFQNWAEVSQSTRASNIKWAKIKDPKRAVEKVLRVYRGDVSRLVDLTRQSIIFEQVSELLTCLDVILEDPEVDVLRIKNRLDSAYDSSISAGYRDVAMNLRVITEDARTLCVDTHVCEVQLILRQFAELKSDQGHKRYVEFRNARAE